MNIISEEFDHKKALLLAGKLAIMASMVIGCTSPFLYSTNVTNLEQALSEYNNYIFKYPVKHEK